jgi:hypothetical protein
MKMIRHETETQDIDDRYSSAFPSFYRGQASIVELRVEEWVEVVTCGEIKEKAVIVSLVSEDISFFNATVIDMVVLSLCELNLPHVCLCPVYQNAARL